MILSDVILKKNYISNMKFIYETNRNIREIWRHDSFLIRIGSETYDIKANAAEREAEREAHQKKRKFYDDQKSTFYHVIVRFNRCDFLRFGRASGRPVFFLEMEI